MKFRIPTLKLLLALLVSLPPLSNANAWIYGPGAESCGTWTAEHIPTRTPSGNRQEFWLLGFVSAAGEHGLDLKEADGHAIVGWVNNYCKENPLKGIYEAANKLVEELTQ